MPAPVYLEGGDALVIGNGALLVGMGERTRPATVEMLADRLFSAGVGREVIAVEIPPQRATMHLDTVLTMVDHDTFTIFPELRGALRSYRITPGPAGLSITQQDDLFEAIARALDLPKIRLIETGGGTGSRPSASNGTTATTSWPSPREWWWPTSETSTPTPSSVARASRSSPSRGRSSAGGGAGRAACRARSSVTPSPGTAE